MEEAGAGQAPHSSINERKPSLPCTPSVEITCLFRTILPCFDAFILLFERMALEDAGHMPTYLGIKLSPQEFPHEPMLNSICLFASMKRFTDAQATKLEVGTETRCLLWMRGEISFTVVFGKLFAPMRSSMIKARALPPWMSLFDTVFFGIMISGLTSPTTPLMVVRRDVMESCL